MTQNLIRVGANGMRLYLLMLPIIGFQVTVVGYFQATGKPKKSLFFEFISAACFLSAHALGFTKVFWTNGCLVSGSSFGFSVCSVNGGVVV